MQQSKRAHRLRSYLVKGYSTAVCSLLITVTMLIVCGFSDVGFTLFHDLTPWFVRAAIGIACVLSVSIIAEAI
jgi:FtsH-binding integral membrane protein